MSNERVTAGHIDDAPAPEPSSGTARDLPRFEELFSRQAIRTANHATHPIEQRLSLKKRQGPRCESGATAGIETHAALSRASAQKYRTILVAWARRTPARPIARGNDGSTP